MDEMENIFLAELDPGHSASIQRVEEELRPLFTALPKSATGRLDTSTVRYALHRYFVEQHGWFIKGLDHQGGAPNSSFSGSIMKDRAPSYIQGLFEQSLQGKGFGLHEIAAFAATLTDIIQGEAIGDLQHVFTSLDLPKDEFLMRDDSDYAIKAYLITYFGDRFAKDKAGLKSLERRLIRIYPGWKDSFIFAKDLRFAHELSQSTRHNPFVEHRDTFNDVASFVREFVHSFGRFQNTECVDLKRRLVDMEHAGSGRVRLSRFYKDGVEKGDWTFMNSVAYLRMLGALDETDPNNPIVIIPNYINSRANCISHSGFYSLCCLDECEGLMRVLEREIAGPSAVPARIAGVVSGLRSDTVDAPRNLSTKSLTRLNDIAAYHDGVVPLHGRLFAQWMHHAYPRECVFPQISGTTDPMSQNEWNHRFGFKSDATKDEMLSYVNSYNDAGAADYGKDVEDLLPWDFVEELVVSHKPPTVPTLGFATLWRPLMAFAALVAVVKPLAQTSRTLPGSKIEQYTV